MTNRNSGEPKGIGYKRWFDLLVLVLAHLLLMPLWLLLWIVIPIVIRLGDRGPVFYRQQRMGKGGKPFSLLKFRTMIVGADRQGPSHTRYDDPRITRIGRILRRTALDELPELINICKGDMSFVGPRALYVEEHHNLEKLIPGFENRLQVPPGLTGLAQIFDKSDDSSEKYRYDMEYLQKLGPFLDARLLVLSVWNTLSARWDHRSGDSTSSTLRAEQSEPAEDFLEPTESKITNREL